MPSRSKDRNSGTTRGGSRCRHCRKDDGGFSLLELLIVTAIMPLIMGALAVGIISIFKLQSGVANRLGDTADAQAVSSVYSRDASGALYVTTSSTQSPQCSSGVGTALLSLNLNSSLAYSVAQGTGLAPVISYVLVPSTGSPGVNNLERLSCANESPSALSSPSVSILAYDVYSAVPTITCVGPVGVTTTTNATSSCSNALAATTWMQTLSVSQIKFVVTERSASGFSYTLDASPINAGSSNGSNTLTASSASSSCVAPLPNTGSLSSTMCLVDFSLLNNPSNLAQATQTGGCLNMSVSVGSSSTLFFCLNISGATVTPSVLPTYSQAFLGNSFCLSNLGGAYANSTTCLPFYSGITGLPAFYQNTLSPGNYTTTLSFTQISLINNSTGLPATGWHILSADAESTDASSLPSESITWTADTPLTPVCDGEFWDSCSTTTTNAQGQIVYGTDSYGNIDYWGNACLDDQKYVGLVQPNPNEIQCFGGITTPNGTEQVTGGPKNGAAIVEAIAPKQFTITMSSPYLGLEGVAFGLSVSGVSS